MKKDCNWKNKRKLTILSYSLFLVSLLFLLHLSVHSWSFIITHCPIPHPILLPLREREFLTPSFGTLGGNIMAGVLFSQ